MAKVRHIEKASLQLEAEAFDFTALTADDFTPATLEEKADFIKERKSVSYWQDAWRRLRKNTVSMVALVVIILIAIFAFAGPTFVPYAYAQQIRGSENLRPMEYSQTELERKAEGESVFPHVFGTDNLGRDIMVRTMMGTRVSMLVGIFAAILVLIIGSIYGSISGYAGGIIDNIMMRIVDIVTSVPEVLIVLLLSVTLKPFLENYINSNPSSVLAGFATTLGAGLISIFITFALLYWVTMARIVRGQVLQLKQQEFITASTALGASKKRIISRHLLPNCVGSMIAATCLQIPSAIFLESFLSFLGMGVSAPMTSLGSMCSDALSGMYTYTYRLIIPALILSGMLLAFNLFGDGLRDALDPRLKK